MRIPDAVKAKYAAKLDLLIEKGAAIPVRLNSVPSGGNFLTGQTHYSKMEKVSWSEFVEWRTSCVTVLDQAIPKASLHRKTVDAFHTLGAAPDKLTFALSFLRSIRTDLEEGFLESLAGEISAEISADYLSQAEGLLSERSAQDVTHVPAAVLAGAVLEKTLRDKCTGLEPPEPTASASGAPLSMGGLIDALKRRGAFNELMAKQLRAWADIRNSAAHGRFDEFSREQVQAMVSGIGEFVTRHG